MEPIRSFARKIYIDEVMLITSLTEPKIRHLEEHNLFPDSYPYQSDENGIIYGWCFQELLEWLAVMSGYTRNPRHTPIPIRHPWTYTGGAIDVSGTGDEDEIN
jgi:hypothetical protein